MRIEAGTAMEEVLDGFDLAERGLNWHQLDTIYREGRSCSEATALVDAQLKYPEAE